MRNTRESGISLTRPQTHLGVPEHCVEGWARSPWASTGLRGFRSSWLAACGVCGTKFLGLSPHRGVAGGFLGLSLTFPLEHGAHEDVFLLKKKQNTNKPQVKSYQASNRTTAHDQPWESQFSITHRAPVSHGDAGFNITEGQRPL